MNRTPRMAALGLAAALALAGCSSSGGKKATESSAAPGGKANTPSMTVALVTHSGPGDTFWDLVRKGAQAAAAKDNIKLEYSADPDGTKQASLVQAAVDKKVDGIATTLAKPDAMKGAVGNAVKAKIPVVGLNSGSDVYKNFGMIGFFGQPEKVAGQAVGDKLKSAGAKKPICIIHEQGNVGLEDRCNGVKEKVPATQIVYVNGNDLPSVQSTVTAKLQQDKAIDWIVGLNADITLNAVKAKKAAGSSAKVGTFDTNADLVKAIQGGDVEFAVDQQPWLQGYLAVDSIWLYTTNGDTVGGGMPTLTGPAFVDKSNVDAVAKFAAAGTR
ncbi:sugar ABC transporter substrate-binding protein [Calidifontibacter sp. DB0510]|uniref:Sugar ABC transporter substrate-binding protein n=1 Tax=Metallococcus carri TaxID=1656884 RepID=A0A967B2A4_9MICO|nr:substrate-binding domain-containing protein [Metallococcus carri]NHN56218.1 sugar ABC transporter substrate-binding protein [Metallococcus carri]NOP38731.1 substrate-binding domain-containing protein [Calidifontibacter sp. DB2511S]